MKKYLLLNCFLGFFVLFAQEDKQDKVLNININADRALKKFNKIQANPERKDTVMSVGSNQYSVEPMLLPKTNPISDSLKPLKLGVSTVLDTLHRAYIKTGIGVLNASPWVDLYYNSLRKKRWQYGVMHNHLSSFWYPWNNHRGIADNTMSRYFMDNYSRVWLKHVSHDWVLSSHIDYLRNDLNFYGFDNRIYQDANGEPLIASRDSIRQHHQKAGASLQFATQKDTTELNWGVNFRYHYFDERFAVQEHYAKADAFVKFFLSEWLFDIRFGLDYNGQLVAPNQKMREKDWINRKYQDQNSSLLFAHPVIYYQARFLEMKLGLNLSTDMAMGKFYIFPDIEFRIITAKGRFIPYLGVSGQVERQSFFELTRKNPYISEVQKIDNTYTPTHAYLGFRGSISKYLTYNLAANYRYTQKEAFFVPDTLASLGYKYYALYADYQRLFLSGEISFSKAENIKVSLLGGYNFYFFDKTKLDQVWYKPDFEIRLNSWFKVKEKWAINFGVYAQGFRYARVAEKDLSGKIIFPIEELMPYVDANIGVEYFFTKRFTLWGNVNNLAHQLYERYAGYTVQGIQVYAGVTYKFWR